MAFLAMHTMTSKSDGFPLVGKSSPRERKHPKRVNILARLRQHLTKAYRRLSATPLHSPVLHALSVSAKTHRPRPHAHCHLEQGADGHTRLEFSWHVEECGY
jgi:hypothetical protein